MPYRTKAELDRENWKTIPDTITDICATDDCEPKAARHQLRKALAAGDLWPLRWQLEKRDRVPERKPPGSFAVPDDLPPREQVWSDAKIRWKTGKVRDDWGDYNKGKWRVLLIHRLSVAQYWKSPTPRGSSPLAGSMWDKGIRISRKRGPKAETGCRVRDQMRNDVHTRKLTSQQLAQMTEEALKAHYHASRDTCRKARREVLSQSEFVDNSPNRNSDK
jgi:hypothetical protein